jgi:hypothetical protein
VPDRIVVGSDNATTRPKASRPLDITAVRINGGRLSFAGSFGGATMIVPMRPFLAGRIASVAPGAPIVQFGARYRTGASLRGTAEQAGSGRSPILKRM